MEKRGAKPKLENEKVRKKLLRAIRDGNYMGAAAAAAGVDRTTVYRWIDKGEAEDDNPENEIYRDFVAELRQAEAEAEAHAVRVWRTHFYDDWKAAATFLERRFPDRWGRVDRINAQVQHKGQMGLNINVNYGDTPPDEEEDEGEGGGAGE